jgi:hypothetical protein
MDEHLFGFVAIKALFQIGWEPFIFVSVEKLTLKSNLSDTLVLGHSTYKT